jgi:predicted DNA-binding WGR domain protein
MKLIRQTKLHFREGNSDKIYEVDLCEIENQFLVNFRYGKRGTDLKEGSKTSNPVSREEADKIFQKLIDEKTRKGYHVVVSQSAEAAAPKAAVSSGVDEEARKNTILASLQNPKAKSNPRIERIIWRAGELKIKESAAFLPNLLGTGKDLRDYCIAWSLGFCGEEDSISVLEKLNTHPAEFVRRIAREAIFKLADEPLRNQLREKVFIELPESLKSSIKFADAESFEAALRSEIENQKRGSYNFLTQIYAADFETTRPALLGILSEAPFKPRYFKPIRHIFKMAEYRRDAEVFGIIARRFEIESAGFHASPWWDSVYLEGENGKWATVKRSDELAKDNSRLAYSNKTKDYFRRRTWRTLRRLGELGDADYVKMAVGALLAYTDADALEPRVSTIYDYHHTGSYDWRDPKTTTVRYDAYAPYLLFNHILYGNSKRYEFKPGTRAFRLIGNTGDKVPSFREESFPKLWEAQPAALLHLIAESNCRPVHEFAVKVLRDCPNFLKNLDVETIIMMLSRPFEATANLGFELVAARYDAANPNVELVTAIAVSNSAEARREAFKWIDAKRDLYAKNASVMLRLLTSEHRDARDFAAKLMQSTNYNAVESQNLIALLISEILSLSDSKREIAKDLGEIIFKSFSRELRAVNLQVVQDLLTHPLVEVQILGGNVLLNHETRAENLSNDLINSLIASPFEEIRRIGIKLFGQLPDENLLNRESVFLSFLLHELIDIYASTRPIVIRLAGKYSQFAENLAHSIYVRLLQEETVEGLHSRLFEVLREIPDWENFATYETARLLAKADSAQANEAGGLILLKRAAEWTEEISTAEIVDFTNAEVLAIRQASWQFAENNTEKMRAEVSGIIDALDSKWEDSRQFWFDFFRERLSEKELTPEILIAISDSVKPETQKFGRDLLLKYFKEENGAEYLLKLSEHPSANMQLFATNYLENHAAGSPEKFEKLAPYFVRVLSLVNRSRAAKNRILQFLEREALKAEDSARIAAGILARHSATIAVGDRARMIEMMLKIQRKYPNLSLPLKIKMTEVREKNAV